MPVIENHKITTNFHALVPPLVIALLHVFVQLGIFLMVPPLCTTSGANPYKFVAMLLAFIFFIRWTTEANTFLKLPKLRLEVPSE